MPAAVRPQEPTGLFIQVRLGSTRLPGKALLPLTGGCIIEHVMRSLRPVPARVRALLTDAASAGALRPLAAAEGYQLMVGPDEDVLGRYAMACRRFGVRRAVRATGDNPLTSARLARGIMAEHGRSGADLSHYLGVPWGSGVEVAQAEALYAAEQEARSPEEREHVMTFLYRNPGRFAILEAQAPGYADCPGARVTVDTPEDWEVMQRLFRDLYAGQPIEIDLAIRWLRSQGLVAPAGSSMEKGNA